MRRKFDVALKQWLPAILACYQECEEMDLISIYRYCGRALVVLGPEVQIEEINSVVEYLKDQEYLIVEGVGENKGWLGQSFQNEVYSTSEKMAELLRAALEAPSGHQTVVRHSTKVTNYNFNLSLSAEKLIEVNPTLELNASLFGLMGL